MKQMTSHSLTGTVILLTYRVAICCIQPKSNKLSPSTLKIGEATGRTGTNHHVFLPVSLQLHKTQPQPPINIYTHTLTPPILTIAISYLDILLFLYQTEITSPYITHHRFEAKLKKKSFLYASLKDQETDSRILSMLSIPFLILSKIFGLDNLQRFLFNLNNPVIPQKRKQFYKETMKGS